MPRDALTAWIRRRRRSAFAFSAVYGSIVLAGGVVALLLTSAVAFVGVRILVLITAPMFPFGAAVSVVVAGLLVGAFFIDSIHAARDDMSILPLWFVREYAGLGPRAVLEGAHSAARAWRLARLNVPFCAKVLSYLAWKSRSVAPDELQRELPGASWADVVAQVGLFDGVLLLNRASRLTLTLGLRLELRSFGVRKRVAARPEPEPVPEAEAVPVMEPEKLNPADLLGVPANASIAEIKLAYRHRIKECHPDRFAGMDERTRESAEQWTKALNAAYQALLSQAMARKTAN